MQGEVELMSTSKKVGVEVQWWRRIVKFHNPYLCTWQNQSLQPQSTANSYLWKIRFILPFMQMQLPSESLKAAFLNACGHIKFLGSHEESLSGKWCFIYSLTLKECFVFLSVLWSAVNTYSEVYCKYTIITTVHIHLRFNSYVNLC